MTKYKKFFMGLLGLVLAGVVTSIVIASGVGSKFWGYLKQLTGKSNSGPGGTGTGGSSALT